MEGKVFRQNQRQMFTHFTKMYWISKSNKTGFIEKKVLNHLDNATTQEIPMRWINRSN